ncbi:deoxynucleoside kinase [Phaeocystidibacter luteus]|uniref:Deoxynucleoside kinase n=1 Tax=Phaeocystidibacter luteus TaxID=911197 RepID=A0A6N6RCI0_9FLAO|nr:deoxynucleoside kinase [Phaeocystidibacter luteus]KAB2805325.1 deoxynucleoside kinase [Phaeocystidibacter luteus]
MKNRFIAFEGNIGAGKTTLVRNLARRWNAKMFLEQFEDNPFLPSFYENPEKYAFPLEMSFLAERFQQLNREVRQTELFSERIIADYAPYKSLIFAGKTLDHAEYGVYKKMHQLLFQQVPYPDVVIYLHIPVERLLKNIEKRGRSYEQDIDPEYLDSIEKGYFDFYRSRPDLVTLVVEPAGDDYANDEKFMAFVDELLEWNWSPGRHVVQQD